METKETFIVSKCSRFMSINLTLSISTSSSPMRGDSCSSQIREGVKKVQVCIFIKRGMFWTRSWKNEFKSSIRAIMLALFLYPASIISEILPIFWQTSLKLILTLNVEYL